MVGNVSGYRPCQAPYAWLGTQYVLLIKGDPANYRDKPVDTVNRLDLFRGSCTELTKADALWETFLGASEVNTYDRRYVISVSPDHSHIAWSASAPDSFTVSQAVCRLDGSGWHAVFTDGPGRIIEQSCWSRDSKLIYSLDWQSRPAALRTFTPDLNLRGNIPISNPRRPSDLSPYPGPLGQLPTGELLAAYMGIGAVPCSLIRVSFTAGAARWSAHSETPTRGSSFEDVALSPNGSRLAWLALYRGTNPLRYEVWVSKTDGSALRSLGFILGFAYALPLRLQWTPDGGSVSFIYGSGLYVLPVP